MIGAAALCGPTPRQWIACADDFALDDGAVDGILALIERGRITATAALVDAPSWRSAAARLRASDALRHAGASAGLDVGLHLNLTQAFGAQTATVWPLAELIARCALRAVPHAQLDAAIERQLDRFEDAMGRRPDYVDGHQHVHQFAVVRDVLLRALQRRYRSELPWLRSTRVPRRVRDVKARGIALLGDRQLRERAAALRFRTNACLVGVYDFRADAASYRQRLEQWLRAGPQATVLMTHPALRTQPADALAAARTMEYRVLASEEFAALLAQAGITLTTGTLLFASSGNSPVAAAQVAGG